MHETIAVVFDFDDTLAPDTTSGFLRHCGLDDVGRFWKDRVDPLVIGGSRPSRAAAIISCR